MGAKSLPAALVHPEKGCPTCGQKWRFVKTMVPPFGGDVACLQERGVRSMGGYPVGVCLVCDYASSPDGIVAAGPPKGVVF